MSETYYGDHTGLWFYALANKEDEVTEYGPFASRQAALEDRSRRQGLLDTTKLIYWCSTPYEDRLRFAEMPSFLDLEENVTLYPPLEESR